MVKASLFPTTLVGHAGHIREQMKQIIRARLGKRGKLRRPPRMLYPAPAERDYRAQLLAVTAFMKRTVHERVIANIPRYVSELKRERPSHADAAGSDFDADLGWCRAQFGARYSKHELAAMARKAGQAVNTWNRKQNQNVIGKVLGIDVLASEPWVEPVIGAYVGENVTLIESIATRYFEQVAQRVYQAFREGERHENLAQYLEETVDDRGEVADFNAERIARDQIGKLNGQLTKERQGSLGIERYRWRGALDQRERDEHVAREGEVFDWDDPPEDGHPGEPILCRCYAEPVLEDE